MATAALARSVNRHPNSPIFLSGFSLGGNVITKVMKAEVDELLYPSGQRKRSFSSPVYLRIHGCPFLFKRRKHLYSERSEACLRIAGFHIPLLWSDSIEQDAGWIDVLGRPIQ